MNGSFFKQKCARNEAYLDWVRTQPCCGCGYAGRQNAHHCIADRYGNLKHSDLHTFALCNDCHRLLHKNWRDWEEAHGSQWKHVADTVERAFSEGILEVNTRAIKMAW